MAPDKDERFELESLPPIPSYDEAISAPGATSDSWRSRTSTDVQRADLGEAESLLNSRHPYPLASVPSTAPRRHGGYRQPTVETEDEESEDDSLFDFDGVDGDAEASHVRREMQEMDLADSDAGGRAGLSSWSKRIGLPFSLKGWRWWQSWNWHMPRFRIRLGDEGEAPTMDSDDGIDAGDIGESEPRRRRWWQPVASMPAGVSGLLVLQVAGRLFAILAVMGFLYLLFMSDLFASMARKMGSQMFDPESVRNHIQATVSSTRMRETLRHFSGYAHVAGTEGDFALAIDTKNMFARFGLEDITVDEYQVYLNYAKAGGRAVEILGADGNPTWTATLEEQDRGGEAAGRQTYAFHGHSKAGDVKGPLIYANYGSEDDFKVLRDSGIDTGGAIALVRHHGPAGSDVAMKVRGAELAGFVGCLVYSDPADDGFLRGETAPKGRFMPADGVQRGAVSLTSRVMGDVLTPGWASKPNMPRMKVEQTKGLVKIPSLPLAWRDAQVLLQHMQSAGQRVPSGWVGGVPDTGEWWTGNQSSPVVRLRNEQDENEKQAVWNVYGRIKGAEQHDKKIIIGTHRDAWCFGAAKVGSGTAVMMEVARVYGDLLARGWRPLRTIEFMSWDASEYNMIGSTEYVEQNDALLRQNAVAYINLDSAVSGGTFSAAGSPMFRKLLLQVLSRVVDPFVNATLRDLWDRRGAKLEGLAADSDYAAFQHVVGTSSLDVRFDSGEPYPRHSCYDTFDWTERVADPGFVYHGLLAQVLGLLVIELADRPVLPFDLAAYADSLPTWAADLQAWAADKGPAHAPAAPASLRVLRGAIDDVAMRLREFQRWELSWETSVVAANGWEPVGLGKRRCEYNSRLALFESDLLDEAGAPNRTQYKHVVFGPELRSRRDVAYFPAIRDTMLVHDWALANKTVEKVASILRAAAEKLVK